MGLESHYVAATEDFEGVVGGLVALEKESGKLDLLNQFYYMFR